MTVNELIEALSKVKDKEKVVYVYAPGSEINFETLTSVEEFYEGVELE